MSLASLLVVGFIAQSALPVQLLPSGFSPPFMWIEFPTLPAAPADNERDVAEPVEAVLSTLPNLDSLRTFVRSTEVGFRVALDNDADVDAAQAQIRDRLDRVSTTLPEGSRRAFIWRHNPNDDPVFILGVTYPADAENPARVLREQLAQPLERVSGVSRVVVRGVAEHHLRIELDEQAVRSHGVDTAQLVQRLQRNNFSLAVGALEAAGQRVLVRALARFQELSELKAMPVADGVVLGDIARVFIGPDPTPLIHRINGEPAATLMVFKEATANTIGVSEAISAAVDARLAAPALVEYRAERFFDQGRYIGQSIEQLRLSALYGGMIAIIILFSFLRSLGMTLLITFAIPLCLLVTVIVLYFSGDSLNVLSMMGLMLSVGMVVDNAIVVLENIDRHRRQGQQAASAAVSGAGEVSLAITLATLTTLVVFLPMILLGGSPMISFYLGKIGFPVCYGLLASLFVALVYIPVGAMRMPVKKAEDGVFFRGLRDRYAALLGLCLRHRLPASLTILALLFSTSYPAGKVRRVDQLNAGLDSVRVHLWGPPNGSHEQLDATAARIERAIGDKGADLDVKAVLARRGWTPEHVMIQVFFVDIQSRKLERRDAIAELRKLLPQRPGYSARVGWRGGGGDEAGLKLQVMGPDTQVATAFAQQVIQQLDQLSAVDEAHLEEPDSGTELRLFVDREAAGRAGVNPRLVGGTVDYSLRGRRLDDFHARDQDVEMWIQLAPEDREQIGQLAQIQVRAPDAIDGTPIEEVTRAERTPGYGKIYRNDRQTTVTITVTGEESVLFPQLAGFVPTIAAPDGYKVGFGERFRGRRKNEEGGSFAVLTAIVLVFFLMGVLFESVILPFSILLSIPLAFCGVFWTLFLTDTPLDIMAIVGCIILVGVVVNNGIVLIDQVQQRRADGAPRDEALIESGRQRIRPILMTALTTIGGLIPMALGNASLLGIEYYPLGRVVIGGLLAGTVLTLVAVPVLYSLLDDLRGIPARLRFIGRGLTPNRFGLVVTPLKRVTANGIDFAYYEAGEGPLVLCLHGYPDTPETFDALVPRLAGAGYRVVAPYMRGYAPTGLAPDDQYGGLTLGEDVVALIDALGAENARLVGHDWGAMATYLACAMAPERITQAVTMAIPHPRAIGFDPRVLFKAWHFVFNQFTGFAGWWLRRNDFAGIDAIWRRWSPGFDLPPEETAAVKACFRQPGALRAALRYYKTVLPNPFSARSRALDRTMKVKIEVPTLALFGLDDGVLTPRFFAKTPRHFSGDYRFEGLPDCGHFLLRERPDEVIEKVLEFLE